MCDIAHRQFNPMGQYPCAFCGESEKPRSTQNGHTGPMSSPRFFKKVGISCSYLQAAPYGQGSPLAMNLHCT